MKPRNFVCLLGTVAVLVACGKSEPKPEAAPGNVPAATVAAAPASGAGDLGIALYPGMETLMEGHRIPGGNSGYVIDSAYKSADKPEKVAAYYREQLSKKFGSNGFAETPAGEGMVHLIAGSEKAGQIFDIMIRAEGDGTVMSIRVAAKSN
jgi:hypothetical protein